MAEAGGWQKDMKRRRRPLLGMGEEKSHCRYEGEIYGRVQSGHDPSPCEETEVGHGGVILAGPMAARKPQRVGDRQICYAERAWV